MPKRMQSDQAEINPSEPPPLLEWINAHSEALPDTPLRHEPALAAEPSINLSGSNTLRQLLEERQCLAESLRAIKDRIDEIDTTIKNIMGDATIGMLPDWTICTRSCNAKLLPSRLANRASNNQAVRGRVKWQKLFGC